jgi:Protein of unknown function (DUF2635)
METRVLKPAPGLQVRSPGTGRVLPADGEEVEMSSYWHRRLRDGDVVEVAASRPRASKSVE